MVASIYDSRGEAAAQPRLHSELVDGALEVVIIVGGNWTLSCDSTSLCRTIEVKFGGKLVVTPTAWRSWPIIR